MLKNRFFAALAIAGVVGFAACAQEEAAEAELEAPVVEEPAAAPITPAPVTTDTMPLTDTTTTGTPGAPMTTDTVAQ